MTDPTDDTLKAAFAAFLLESPDKPFEAALKLFPMEKDRGKACQVTFTWPQDPYVIAEMERLKSDGWSAYKPPTKFELIQKAMAIADNEKISPKERNAALKLAAELQGMIVKASTLDLDDNRKMPQHPLYKVVEE